MPPRRDRVPPSLFFGLALFFVFAPSHLASVLVHVLAVFLFGGRHSFGFVWREVPSLIGAINFPFSLVRGFVCLALGLLIFGFSHVLSLRVSDG